MPEREPHVPAQLLFDLLDRVECLPRVRALVIAVLDDQAAGGRAANMIGFLVQRRQGQLLAIKVSGCHLVPVILRASSRGRQAGRAIASVM
jgi:hypothetical protein